MIGLHWMCCIFRDEIWTKKNRTRLCIGTCWPVYQTFRLNLCRFLISALSLQSLSPSWQAGTGGEGEKMSFVFCFLFLNNCPSCPHHCQLVTWSSSFAIANTQVIPLDITVELQKQIMSELEILYKVSGHLGSVSTLFTGCFNHIYYVFN